jgi:hypothetical protein
MKSLRDFSAAGNFFWQVLYSTLKSVVAIACSARWRMVAPLRGAWRLKNVVRGFRFASPTATVVFAATRQWLRLY